MWHWNIASLRMATVWLQIPGKSDANNSPTTDDLYKNHYGEKKSFVLGWVKNQPPWF
jgi:hypothetical protein